MGVIRLNIDGVLAQSQDIESARRLVKDVQSTVSSLSHRVDPKIRQRYQIDSKLQTAANQLSGIHGQTGRIKSTVENSVTGYYNTEMKARRQAQEIAGEKVIVSSAAAASPFLSSNAVQQNPVPAVENKAQFSLFQTVKNVIQGAGKFDKLKVLGFPGDVLDYGSALHQFLTQDMKGLTGVKNLWNLSDKSCSLYASFYDGLKYLYKNQGAIFENKNMLDAMGTLSAGAGLIGMGSAGIGALDAIKNNPNIGMAGIAGEMLGMGDEALEFAGDIAELNGVDKTPYSPFSKYMGIAKAYTVAGSQCLKSYDQYASDGSYDVGDIGATGVDAAVAGLGSMVDTFSLGIISEETTGISSQEVSQAIKEGAGTVGQNAGNYILNNPDLHRMYKNSNTAGRVALTLYASIGSVFQK